jgi:hypothetical protein
MHFKTLCVNMLKKYIFFSLPGANSASASISSLEYQPNVPDSHGCHHKSGNHPYQGFHRSGITIVKKSFVLIPSFEYQPHAPDTHGCHHKHGNHPRWVFQRFMYSYYYCPLEFSPLFHHLNISLIEQTFIAAIKIQQLSSSSFHC